MERAPMSEVKQAVPVFAASPDTKSKEEYQKESVMVPRQYLSGAPIATLKHARSQATPAVVKEKGSAKDMARLRNYIASAASFQSIIQDKERLKSVLNNF